MKNFRFDLVRGWPNSDGVYTWMENFEPTACGLTNFKASFNFGHKKSFDHLIIGPAMSLGHYHKTSWSKFTNCFWKLDFLRARREKSSSCKIF
jgi:hypothetical protein